MKSGIDKIDKIDRIKAKIDEIRQCSNDEAGTKKMLELLDLNYDDYKKALSETGDQLTAQLQAKNRNLLGKEVSDTITLNGNVIPEELYDQISRAAQIAITFKYNRMSLENAISYLKEGNSILLTPIQIAQLLVNTEPEDKELFDNEDKELINELCAEAQIYTPEEARTLLQFLQLKRLSTKENTDLYKRIVRCLETNYDYSLLLTEDGTLLRTSSQNTEDKKRDDEATPENKGIIKKREFQSPKMNRSL